MDKKQKRKFERYEAIPMITFLKDFVGITEQLKKLKNATHKDIKWIGFENIVAVPFECVDNDDLATGDVILVIDVKNHIAPYKNPLRKKHQKVKVKTKDYNKLNS